MSVVALVYITVHKGIRNPPQLFTAVMYNMTRFIAHVRIILLIYQVLIQFLLQMDFSGSLCMYNSTHFIPGNNFICLLYG